MTKPKNKIERDYLKEHEPEQYKQLLAYEQAYRDSRREHFREYNRNYQRTYSKTPKGIEKRRKYDERYAEERKQNPAKRLEYIEYLRQWRKDNDELYQIYMENRKAKYYSKCDRILYTKPHLTMGNTYCAMLENNGLVRVKSIKNFRTEWEAYEYGWNVWNNGYRGWIHVSPDGQQIEYKKKTITITKQTGGN